MTFTAQYIDDAATRIEHRTHKSRPYTCSNYQTPENGIHLCGQHVNGEEPCTVASYPLPRAQASKLFEIARSVAAVDDKEEGDFVVDLCVNGDIVDDFYSNRQVWPCAIAAWNEALPDKPTAGEVKP